MRVWPTVERAPGRPPGIVPFRPPYKPQAYPPVSRPISFIYAPWAWRTQTAAAKGGLRLRS
jgi:hypothetical protein